MKPLPFPPIPAGHAPWEVYRLTWPDGLSAPIEFPASNLAAYLDLWHGFGIRARYLKTVYRPAPATVKESLTTGGV